MRLADFLRADAVAHKNFLVRAAPHVWPRVLRALEAEIARPSRR